MNRPYVALDGLAKVEAAIDYQMYLQRLRERPPLLTTYWLHPSYDLGCGVRFTTYP